MTRYFTISSFRNALQELLKVKKGVYKGIEEEIVAEFKDKPIEQIRQNRDMILLEGDAIIIKLRLPDKKQRLSKKDGYRLIYLVSKEKEIITFLFLYPKNGPCQKISISRDDLKFLLNEFIKEVSSNSLVVYNPLTTNK